MKRKNLKNNFIIYKLSKLFYNYYYNNIKMLLFMDYEYKHYLHDFGEVKSNIDSYLQHPQRSNGPEVTKEMLEIEGKIHKIWQNITESTKLSDEEKKALGLNLTNLKGQLHTFRDDPLAIDFYNYLSQEKIKSNKEIICGSALQILVNVFLDKLASPDGVVAAQLDREFGLPLYVVLPLHALILDFVLAQKELPFEMRALLENLQNGLEWNKEFHQNYFFSLHEGEAINELKFKIESMQVRDLLPIMYDVGGHIIYFLIQKRIDNSYDFFEFNTGEGIQAFPNFIPGSSKSATFNLHGNIPSHMLANEGFLQKFMKLQSTAKSMTQVRKLLDDYLGPSQKIENLSPKMLQSIQIKGSCGVKAFIAMCRFLIVDHFDGGYEYFKKYFTPIYKNELLKTLQLQLKTKNVGGDADRLAAFADEKVRSLNKRISDDDGSHTYVKNLDLSKKPFLSDEEVRDALRDPKNRLIDLDIKNNAITDGALEGLKEGGGYIQHLDLSGCRALTDQSLHLIGSHCHDLTKLILMNLNQITSEGIKALVEGCPLLETLVFKNCEQIDDQALEYISKLPKLRQLALTNCAKVTDKGMISLDLTRQKHLQKLYLSGTQLKDLDWAGQEGITHKLPAFRSLYLQRIPELKPESVKKILQNPNLSGLAELALPDTEAMRSFFDTNGAYAGMIAARPKLKISFN